jgi:hypothetical protein
MRFSLRTVIVATLLAGVFAGVNVVPYEMGKVERDNAHVRDYEKNESPIPQISSASELHWMQRGWPASYLDSFEWRSERRDFWSYSTLLLNILLLLVVLTLTWLVLDRPWRKRTRSPDTCDASALTSPPQS